MYRSVALSVRLLKFCRVVQSVLPSGSQYCRSIPYATYRTTTIIPLYRQQNNEGDSIWPHMFGPHKWLFKPKSCRSLRATYSHNTESIATMRIHFLWRSSVPTKTVSQTELQQFARHIQVQFSLFATQLQHEYFPWDSSTILRTTKRRNISVCQERHGNLGMGTRQLHIV